eukprot:12690480-Alexandrium_andersonii.AAC.1
MIKLPVGVSKRGSGAKQRYTNAPAVSEARQWCEAALYKCSSSLGSAAVVRSGAIHMHQQFRSCS